VSHWPLHDHDSHIRHRFSPSWLDQLRRTGQAEENQNQAESLAL
jgi:hypothetical protein